MATRRTRKAKSLAAHTVALGIAAPQVIAHRLARMDRKEFHRMGTEKMIAFNEAWSAMAFEAFRANQKLALSYLQSFWFPWASPKSSVASASRQLNDAALGVLGKGMVPIRRRAVANAKRLGRSKR